MKTIFRVAKTELRTLFYSPIAWFLLIVFLIQCGMSYTGLLTNSALIQEYDGLQVKYLKQITTRVFLQPSGVFPAIMQSLYLYIPLLTMSLISREMGSGTIKLLYSSPIHIWQIVMGKFLAMVVFSLLMVGVIAIYTTSASFHIVNAETGLLATGLLGFFLLMCAYAAIGIFMSTLSTYQIVAAISTFVTIGVLTHIGQHWQRIEFVRDLTYFLSIAGRAQKMTKGLLTTKDVIYFVLIVGLFLSFSISRLKNGMDSRPWTVKSMRFATALAVVLIIGYITSLPQLVGYYDATHSKLNTIKPNIQKILKEVSDSTLEIVSYANVVDEMYYLDHPDAYNEIKTRWEPYLRYNHNVKISKVNYWDSALSNANLFLNYPGKTLQQIAGLQAKRWGMELSEYKSPEEIRKEIDLRPELNRYVMQLKWKGQRTWLRVFDDEGNWPAGAEIGAALNRLQQKKMPRIAFVTGDFQRNIYSPLPRDYKYLIDDILTRQSLVNQGFDAMSVDLESSDVPDSIDALVLADPKDLLPTTKARIMNYINNGGNLLITTEPGKQRIMNPLLSELGVKLMDGMLMQENKYAAPDASYGIIMPLAGTFYKQLNDIQTEETVAVTTPTATPLQWTDSGAFTIRPLLRTPPNAWVKAKPYDPVTMLEARMDTAGYSAEMAKASKGAALRNVIGGVVTYSPEEGDTTGTFATALALSRTINSKEQHIVVIGDADLISTKILSSSAGAINTIFSTAVFSWLTGGHYPLDATMPKPTDNRVTVTVKDINRLKIGYQWIAPGILLALGAVILIRRKRQ